MLIHFDSSQMNHQDGAVVLPAFGLAGTNGAGDHLESFPRLGAFDEFVFTGSKQRSYCWMEDIGWHLFLVANYQIHCWYCSAQIDSII